jgi:hypothetical protein
MVIITITALIMMIIITTTTEVIIIDLAIYTGIGATTTQREIILKEEDKREKAMLSLFLLKYK